jgi:hypothetical protein
VVLSLGKVTSRSSLIMLVCIKMLKGVSHAPSYEVSAAYLVHMLEARFVNLNPFMQ